MALTLALAWRRERGGRHAGVHGGDLELRPAGDWRLARELLAECRALKPPRANVRTYRRPQRLRRALPPPQPLRCRRRRRRQR